MLTSALGRGYSLGEHIAMLIFTWRKLEGVQIERRF